jgi:hypothetical protein
LIENNGGNMSFFLYLGFWAGLGAYCYYLIKKRSDRRTMLELPSRIKRNRSEMDQDEKKNDEYAVDDFKNAPNANV